MSDLFKNMDTNFSGSVVHNPHEENKALCEGHPSWVEWWMPNPVKQNAESYIADLLVSALYGFEYAGQSQIPRVLRRSW